MLDSDGAGESYGLEAGTGGLEVEGFGLHRWVSRFFFLAMPWWWLGLCLARWLAWMERARVWDGAKEQRRTASVDRAKMLRSLTAGIASEGRQREREIKSVCRERRRGREQVEEKKRRWAGRLIWLRVLM